MSLFRWSDKFKTLSPEIALMNECWLQDFHEAKQTGNFAQFCVWYFSVLFAGSPFTLGIYPKMDFEQRPGFWIEKMESFLVYVGV